jgi:NADH pyrophosphatase NudC (nudix superfamily)
MSDEILKRLQSRRSFLKGSALLAASALAVPAVLSAQSQDQQQPPQDQKKQEGREGQDRQDGQDKRDAQDQDKSKDAPQQEAKEGDGAKTYIGADGRPYRVCPQCGSNMYKQGRTWTCENCGYSYDE